MLLQEITAWNKMDEAAMKATTKALVSNLNKMLRRFPWEPDRAVVSRNHAASHILLVLLTSLLISLLISLLTSLLTSSQGHQAVELLRELELCKRAEDKLEKMIIERELAESEMKYELIVARPCPNCPKVYVTLRHASETFSCKLSGRSVLGVLI
jgi:hypothetical protein